VIADSLENHFSLHDLCKANHERQVVAHIQAFPKAVDNNPPATGRPSDVQKLINHSDYKRPVELMAFQTNALGTFHESQRYI